MKWFETQHEGETQHEDERVLEQFAERDVESSSPKILHTCLEVILCSVL